MKSLVIDANVFHAFFFETMHAKPCPDRTGSAFPIFGLLGTEAVSFLDENSQIESEWRNVCKGAEEWFDTWLAEAYSTGRLYDIESSGDAQLLARYRKVGFPGGRDIWYIRVAHSLVAACRRNRPFLVAEDVDFFDPTKKKSTNKTAVFQAGSGPVAKQLQKDGIDVCCISTFCALHLAKAA